MGFATLRRNGRCGRLRWKKDQGGEEEEGGRYNTSRNVKELYG